MFGSFGNEKNGSHRKTRCSVVFAEGCVSIPTVVLVLECLATTKAKFLCCWVWAFLELAGFLWRTYRTDFSICFCAKQLLPGGRICKKVTNFWRKELGTAEANFLKVWEFWLPTSTKKLLEGRPSNCHYCPSRWLSEKETTGSRTHT